jgi:septum formation protein
LELRTKLKLILASASPRRAEILRNAGFLFEVQPANVDETPLTGETPGAYVQRVATAKARATAKSLDANADRAVIIGADTVVVAGGRVLGKPTDADDARRMLKLLSGRDHEVLTGLSLRVMPEGMEIVHVESTRVSFLPLSDKDIEDYLLTGEPFDKAGAYGIQGIGGRFVSRIEGCYFTVMGLPISRLWSILAGLEQGQEKNTATG